MRMDARLSSIDQHYRQLYIIDQQRGSFLTSPPRRDDNNQTQSNHSQPTAHSLLQSLDI